MEKYDPLFKIIAYPGNFVGKDGCTYKGYREVREGGPGDFWGQKYARSTGMLVKFFCLKINVCATTLQYMSAPSLSQSNTLVRHDLDFPATPLLVQCLARRCTCISVCMHVHLTPLVSPYPFA